MKFDSTTNSAIVNQKHIAALMARSRASDRNRVTHDASTCLMFESSSTGMTAGEILHPKLWQKWTPQRRVAMCKLLASMVALDMLPYKLAGKNRRGQNVYIAIEPLPKAFRIKTS